MDLTPLTLSEAASLISSSAISPVELTQAYLSRIEQLDPQLNCFITLLSDTALATAQEAETSIRQGVYKGLLHGIPLALKDVFEIEGTHTTGGAERSPQTISTTDSAVVQKLKYDSLDPCSVNIPVDNYRASLNEGIRGRRIAVAYQPFLREGEQVDIEVLQSVHDAVLVCEQLGASIHETTLPYGSVLRDCNALIVLSEAAAFHHEQLLTTPGNFSDEVLESLKQGTAFSAIDYALARERQRQAQRQFESFFQEYDLLLTPTTPTAAYQLHEDEASKAARPSLTSFTSA